MFADRYQRMEAVLLPGRSSQHTDTQYERLLYNKNQDSRNQKTRKTILRIKQLLIRKEWD